MLSSRLANSSRLGCRLYDLRSWPELPCTFETSIVARVKRSGTRDQLKEVSAPMASGDRRNTRPARDAGSGSASPSKKRKKMTQTEQSERFIETARQLGVDESGEEFERAVKILLPERGK